MQGEVFNFISATFGVSAAVAVVILGVAFWLTHYITKKTTEIKAQHGTLTGNVTKIEGHIDEIRRDISYLKGHTDRLQKTVNDGYTQKNSPISLTEKGKEEVAESRLDEIVDRNWLRINDTLQKEVLSKNPYDIQSYCMEEVFVSPEKFFEDEDFSYIKKLAFNKGLALMTYTNMLAVLIRDRYFQENGIDISEVDKFAPKEKQ